jgi:chromosome partitioning protein
VQQGTLVNWQRRRLAEGREPVESFRSAGSALNGRDGYDLLVLDGPARASSATLEIARFADLVVQPTGASLDDLEPAVLTFHELVREGISREKLLFALCRVQTEAEVRDCRSYLGQAGCAILEGFLPEKPAYRAVQNRGLSVTEIRYPSLRAHGETLVQAIVNRIS